MAPHLNFPDHGFGEHVDWCLSRPEMATGMGKLSSAVYGNTQLPVREREAARYTIAMINECLVCKDTRAEKGPEAGIDEGFYAEVSSWRTSADGTAIRPCRSGSPTAAPEKKNRFSTRPSGLRSSSEPIESAIRSHCARG